MTADSTGPEGVGRRRSRRRLGFLLGFTGLLLFPVIFFQLDPAVVSRLGPTAESWYDLIHAPADRPLTLSGQRMVDELKERGGHSLVIERTPGLFGLLGRKELFSISFPGPPSGGEAAFGDEDLERLVGRYGDRIWGLSLGNTRVTDAGLWHLAKLPDIRHIALGEDGPRDFSRDPLPLGGRITNAGLIHLRGLGKLQTLHIRGVPITDAGLAPLSSLSGLHNLALSRTRVQGSGLASLEGIPRLRNLDLGGSTVTGQGLGSLPHLRMLGHLSLNGIPLSGEGVEILKALPGLTRLQARGCGLSDEQVNDLESFNPKLKVER